MERKVGEIFEYNGEWYQCVENKNCKYCAFININCSDVKDKTGTCTPVNRDDNRYVIFKKLEKVGEPYKGGGRIFQPYQAYIIPVPKWDYEFFMFIHQETKIIDIEIKQNKEDMKEEKLNLKKFDLESAKAGKPVCTRDGRKARIICFDRHGEDCPIIALVVDSENAECEEVIDYTLDGICNENIIDHNKYDLMMLPQKKEGWVKILKTASNEYYMSRDIYKTEEEAREIPSNSYVGVSKISWEE